MCRHICTQILRLRTNFGIECWKDRMPAFKHDLWHDKPICKAPGKKYKASAVNTLRKDILKQFRIVSLYEIREDFLCKTPSETHLRQSYCIFFLTRTYSTCPGVQLSNTDNKHFLKLVVSKLETKFSGFDRRKKYLWNCMAEVMTFVVKVLCWRNDIFH